MGGRCSDVSIQPGLQVRKSLGVEQGPGKGLDWLQPQSLDACTGGVRQGAAMAVELADCDSGLAFLAAFLPAFLAQR